MERRCGEEEGGEAAPMAPVGAAPDLVVLRAELDDMRATLSAALAAAQAQGSPPRRRSPRRKDPA